MSYVEEVKFPPSPFTKYRSLIGKEAFSAIKTDIHEAIEAGVGTVWHINSTATGGGVAEMLPTMLGFALSMGMKWRWLVISGNEQFYEITKRIHNGLHASPGDGGELGNKQQGIYETITSLNLEELKKIVRPSDVVVLHDPQTAGLARGLKKLGATVIWRCHIGCENLKDQYVRRSWSFLEGYLKCVDGYIFTKQTFAPRWVPKSKLWIVHPSIDAFSPKSQDMDLATAHTILSYIGLIDPAGVSKSRKMSFTRRDGTKGKIERYADILHAGPVPKKHEPVIVQISRWDRLKDMEGVMRGFVDHVAEKSDAHLFLVGPSVAGVADDPEGAQTYNECVAFWASLPFYCKRRIQLVSLPMDDIDENAAMVNAIQRHATIIVQKSLYEGFGLTVTEALWKGKPVIASAVGGIQDQISSGRDGLLVKEPANLKEFGQHVLKVLKNRKFATKIGNMARANVLEKFLVSRHLGQYARIFTEVLEAKEDGESMSA